MLAVVVLSVLSLGFLANGSHAPQQRSFKNAAKVSLAGWQDASISFPATTTTTAPPTTTTTQAPHVAVETSRSRPQATTPLTEAPKAASGASGDYTPPPGCMVDAPHPVALAHACWDDLIARYPWPRSTMFSVMMCESRGNPYDVGIQTRYGRAIGLMQDMGGPMDPAANMAVAYQKYRSGSLHPWDASASCWRSARNG